MEPPSSPSCTSSSASLPVRRKRARYVETEASEVSETSSLLSSNSFVDDEDLTELTDLSSSSCSEDEAAAPGRDPVPHCLKRILSMASASDKLAIRAYEILADKPSMLPPLPPGLHDLLCNDIAKFVAARNIEPSDPSFLLLTQTERWRTFCHRWYCMHCV